MCIHKISAWYWLMYSLNRPFAKDATCKGYAISFCPQCVLNGHWIVLEDIDFAPPDVVSLFSIAIYHHLALCTRR